MPPSPYLLVTIQAGPLGFVPVETPDISEYMLTIGTIHQGPIKAHNASCTCQPRKIKRGMVLTHVNGEHLFMLPFVDAENKILRERPVVLTFRDAAADNLPGLHAPAGESGLASKAGELYGQIASMVQTPTRGQMNQQDQQQQDQQHQERQQQQERVQQGLKESIFTYAGAVKAVFEHKKEDAVKASEVGGKEGACTDEVLRRAKVAELLRFVSEHAQAMSAPLLQAETAKAAGGVLAKK
jgi:hypothetical protein